MNRIKKGYKRLIIFQLVVSSILLLNSFVLNILVKYNIIIFLLLSIVLFKCFFGVEKDKNRYIKDIVYDFLIMLIVFFLFYYIFGLYIGFSKNGNYYSTYGITTFIIPLVLSILLKEYLRYNILRKSEGSKIVTITTIILFIVIDLTNVMSATTFSSFDKLFVFIAKILLPVISSNIVLSYVSVNFGYKPNILWSLIINLYAYLLPIVPNVNDYLYSIIFTTFPLLTGYRTFIFLKKYNINNEEEKKTKKKLYFPTIIIIIFLIIVIYLNSGYFKYYAVAIGSGSMVPNIKIGDVVIIEKISENYSNLKVNQVLAYKHNGVIIVHRIEKIIKDNNEYYFYTKGDANKEIDEYVITKEDIIGKVSYKIPYVGLPSIWLKGL